ncbi:hypothetical protein JCM16303_001213 [Sporobolomyces ruberrimus]
MDLLARANEIDEIEQTLAKGLPEVSQEQRAAHKAESEGLLKSLKEDQQHFLHPEESSHRSGSPSKSLPKSARLLSTRHRAVYFRF